MKRREFTAGLLVAASLPQARAQQPAKVHRIAFVTIAVPIVEITETTSLPFRAFFHELRRFGYVEGRNLIVERYSPERATVELARDVLRSKPDVIFANGPWVPILKPLTTIPIVAIMSDPVGFGLVDSLAHPGGNITGVSVDAGPEIITKYLELLKEAFPQASSVGVAVTRFPYPGRSHSRFREQLQEAAQRLGLLLLVPRVEAHQETEYRGFFEVMAQQHAESLNVGTEVETWVHRRLIVELAEKYRLPAIYPYRDYVVAGGLMAYAPDDAELWTRVAGCLAQILNGASPADIPIYQATKFQLLINLKAANAIGLTRRLRADPIRRWVPKRALLAQSMGPLLSAARATFRRARAGPGTSP
jgi:putative tryptophan/tyrosine transport system substrate-binding protein